MISTAARPSITELEAIARDLANAVEGDVRFDLHNRMLYATDASLYQVEPLGVVIPASTDDAVEAVRFCAQRRIPVLPRGGGTSLAGQCTNAAVVLDFSSRCHHLLRVDEAGGTCDVEPGITVDDLNDRLARTRWFFAPDPATSRHCNVGGCIGNNAAGARSILYGRTSENLIAIDACTADGTKVRFGPGTAKSDATVRRITEGVAKIVALHAKLIEERFPRTIRRNAGYGLDMILLQMRAAGWTDADGDRVASHIIDQLNLAPLLCGSEGTLAVTLGATLKLREKPLAKGLACVSFNSLDGAMDAVNPILTTAPSAVELLDDTVIDLARANRECSAYVDLMPQPRTGTLRAVLYVEYFSTIGADDIRAKFEKLRTVIGDAAVEFHTDAGAMLNAWKLRKAGEPLLHGIPGSRKPITFVEDNAVPVERLPEFVRKFRTIVEEHDTRAAFYAHASVGVLHVRPLLDIHDAGDRERMRSISVKIADLARSLGGVMSGEHGDGRIRGPLLERFYGPELMQAFREVKRVFDPAFILNPGMIVPEAGTTRPIESITSNLRVIPAAKGDEYSFVRPPSAPANVPAVDTYFDYADQHGFDGAVEMCNGAGVCRKKQGGTMCPSYQATLDERHATRGRGNALRLAITGQLGTLGTPKWDDAGTIETLDWCLSCKACKTECPSNVDISRLKSEYTAQRYKAAGRPPLKALVFGHVRWLNKLGSITPGIANWFNRTRLAKWGAKTLLGIDPRRSIPAFDRSLASSFKGSAARTLQDRKDVENDSRPIVALFGDCFSMYNETGIGRAARDLFEALGYRVELLDAGCCGRALISTGLLEDAIRGADATLAKLTPWIESDRVKAILVSEPSCLSAFKDDWKQLKLRTDRTQIEKLAAKSFLPEDFADRAWDAHPVKPNIEQVRARAKQIAPGGVMLHGHCHQKALWGSQTSSKLLARLVGEGVRTLDTGCCGMAGSFGFTEKNFDLSMKIGEMKLFPSVRGAQAGSVVCAPGTSCRHQVHDGTGVHAVHPVELAARLVCSVPQ
jgi:FAD/FMN-containing dehydrogenase/Fe-S oxidoreductase